MLGGSHFSACALQQHTLCQQAPRKAEATSCTRAEGALGAGDEAGQTIVLGSPTCAHTASALQDAGPSTADSKCKLAAGRGLMCRRSRDRTVRGASGASAIIVTCRRALDVSLLDCDAGSGILASARAAGAHCSTLDAPVVRPVVVLPWPVV